jgi:hypothetical protein
MSSGTAPGGGGEVVQRAHPAASEGPVASLRPGDTHGVDRDNRPPICPRCGVTMVPAALSAGDKQEGDWVCLECEELDEDE